MEVYLTRGEILRQARALLGMQTGLALTSQVGEQHIAACQAAALKVQQDCRWVNAQRRVTVDLGIQQNVLNYPADCRPGAVMGMAVWDEDAQRYWKLENAIIPVHADQDQEIAEGGDTLTGVDDRPQIYEQRQQINLWPVSDKAYKIRIEYMARADLPEDGTVSIYDGMALAYWTAYLIAAQLSDKDQMAHLLGAYQDRVASLRANQSAGTRIAISTQADLGEGEQDLTSDMPNWFRGPTVRP